MQVPDSPGLQEGEGTAASEPIAMTTQNAAAGRSPVRSTATVAVAAGRMAMTTAPCPAGTAVRA